MSNLRNEIVAYHLHFPCPTVAIEITKCHVNIHSHVAMPDSACRYIYTLNFRVKSKVNTSLQGSVYREMFKRPFHT